MFAVLLLQLHVWEWKGHDGAWYLTPCVPTSLTQAALLLVPWLTSGCTALQSCQHLPVLSLLPRRVQGQLLLRAHCIHAGAGEAWFHLMQLLLPPASGPAAAAAEEGDIQRLAAALHDFVQASSLGQLAQRLQLLHSFRYGPDWARPSECSCRHGPDTGCPLSTDGSLVDHVRLCVKGWPWHSYCSCRHGPDTGCPLTSDCLL